MLERRLTDAAHGVKEALGDLVPPPITDIAGATPRTDAPSVAGTSPLWRGPMIAVGTAVAIIAVVSVSLLMLRGDGQFDTADEPTVTTLLEPAVVATTVAPTTTAPVVDSVVPAAWSTILATTKATVAPTAATCPEGADPDTPGPVDQIRPGGGPGEGPWNNQAAVFDTHQGRIVYLDETGETWTFDVCTNTWEQMEQAPGLGSREVGELVYDIDSDRTISIGPIFVSVYDANTNTWTRESSPRGVDLRVGQPGLGAVYDPVSGLVLVVTIEGALTAYDVDAHTWTAIGIITEQREVAYEDPVTHEDQTQTVGPPFLIGHVAETDRLAFLGFDGAPFQDDGKLVNPRDGSTTPLEEPDGGVMGGFGFFRYATGGETAYTGGRSGNGICRLDPTTLNWDCSTGSQRETMGAVMVYDPINSRIVLINDFSTWPGPTISDDVWAINFDTGEQIELLATANTRTETDGS